MAHLPDLSPPDLPPSELQPLSGHDLMLLKIMLGRTLQAHSPPQMVQLHLGPHVLAVLDHLIALLPDLFDLYPRLWGTMIDPPLLQRMAHLSGLTLPDMLMPRAQLARLIGDQLVQQNWLTTADAPHQQAMPQQHAGLLVAAILSQIAHRQQPEKAWLRLQVTALSKAFAAFDMPADGHHREAQFNALYRQAEAAERRLTHKLKEA